MREKRNVEKVNRKCQFGYLFTVQEHVVQYRVSESGELRGAQNKNPFHARIEKKSNGWRSASESETTERGSRSCTQRRREKCDFNRKCVNLSSDNIFKIF